MTFAPFFAAPTHIQCHILAALLVLVLTPAQFFGPRKGAPLHRALGYLWLAGMVLVALTSFWITESTVKPRIGPFSPIHLLSVMALFSVFHAVRYARARNITGHRKTLISLSIGFLIAGAFTLTPDRIMGRIVWGLG